MLRSHLFRSLIVRTAASRTFSSLTINTINMQRLVAGEKSEVVKLEESLTGLGFFYISDYGIDESRIIALRHHAAELFALPRSVKAEMHLSKSKHFRGWSGIDEEVTLGIPDHKETFDFGLEEPVTTPVTHPWQNFRGPNQWPRGNFSNHKTVVEEYMKAMSELGLVIMQRAVQILGLPPSDLDKYFRRPFSLLRFIHYPAAGGSKLGVGEHSDYGFLTMILQDERAPGLEARAHGEDGPWVPVAPVPGTLAVNIGDAMESWSGGRFRATPHRVINTSLEHGRLSVPFFFEPSLESVFGHAVEGAGRKGLTRNGQEPGQFCYGDHLYKAYIRSYPFLDNQPQQVAGGRG